ncbi:MAG TPA: selenocysteine-specific translation elongation factor, partial [Anaerolineaceae bacterium]|nr:selenocysteine-specific translation elongation factor [Anaerolineaceae bacterium]
MRVIGTAGHVDHGKSTLVQALTGIHPDRLKEEQAREMTIDLGFAWMTLPGDGELVGIVDVPGHRDFIENMLAGVGGIDATLFVVAADEGVMPQTREHLAILDLLCVPAGLVVLTKSDLVDAEWLDLVREDVRKVMQGTVLQDAPILSVSARSGAGLEELKIALAEVLRECPMRLDYNRPRLPVDRVFTIAGFGTVVTGTLLDGQFRLGEDVQVFPGEVRGRVRGLQSHKQKVEHAVQGGRVAINISGVDVSEVKRGDVIALPGTYLPTRRMDVLFRLLPGASLPLKHGAEVKLFLGAAEIQAQARFLGMATSDPKEFTLQERGKGRDSLSPGETGWLQLELNTPVVAVRGDRYILRRPSPGETLGGGEVVDAHPPRRHKRFDLNVLDGLQSLRRGSPGEVLLQVWMKAGTATLREGTSVSHLSAQEAQTALEEIIQNGELIMLEPGEPSPQSDLMAVSAALWRALSKKALAELKRYHGQYSLRRGMPREELRSRLKLTPRVFGAAIRKWVADAQVVEIATLVALPGNTIRFSPPQQVKVDRLMAAFKAAPYTPPSIKDCKAEVGEDPY